MAEDLGNLSVSIGMDATGFQTGMTQINRNLRTLNSEFRMNTAAVGLNGTALDRLRLRSTNLTSSMVQQQNKVNALEAAYNRSVTATGRDSAATQDLEQRLNLARAALSNMDNDLQRTNAQIATQTSRWTRLGSVLTNAGERMKKVGAALENVGSKLTTSLTLPLVAAGAAAAKLGMEFETSMAKVSTISDDTEVPIADLRKAILKLSDDTGIASTEIANNVYDAISAGQSTGDAVNFVTNSTKLAKAGFAEAGQSLDLLTTILNSYGMESKEVNRVSDILIQTQNKGKVTVGELSSSMGKIIPTANSVGVNIEQVASGYAIMTSKGIKAAETTTYMASMFNELGKNGTTANKALEKATGKSFPELIKSGKSVGDILNIMSKYAKKNGLSLTDMFGSAEAGKAALILSGDEGKTFNKTLKEMEKSTGATDEAFEKVNNTTGVRLAKSFNTLKNSAIKFGDALAPIVEKIAKGIQILADKFNSLTPAQQENIVKIGLLVAAIGPALVIIGNLVTIIGGIVTAAGAASTALGITTAATAATGLAAGTAATGGIAVFGAAIGGALLTIAPFLLAAGAIIGTGLAIKNVLDKEVVPKVDLFADKVTTTATSIEGNNARITGSYQTTTTKISEATEKAVGAYIKLDDEATKELDHLYINGTIVTAKILTDLTTKYQAMNTSVKTEMDKRFAVEYQTMVDFYAKSDVLTKTEEEKALVKMQENHKKEKTEEDKATAEILKIIKTRLDKGQAITLEDEQKIKVIQDRKKKNAITLLSKQEGEAKIILDRIKSYGTRITAEQASAEIKNANKSRDDTIKAAKEKEKKTIASIKATTDQSTPEGKKLADSLIKDAKRQTTETVKKAEELRSGVVTKIVKMNSETSKSVNTNTGEMLTNFNKLKTWWNGWTPKVKKFVSELKQITGGSITDNLGIDKNATGDRNYGGGLTTLHEKGYEVYDLPSKTRIYNHEASQDLMLKTAQEVAKGVLANSQGSNGLSFNVENFINNRQQDIQAVAEELSFYIKQTGRG